MVFSFGITSAACYIVGLLYPTYASFKALVSPGAQDDTQWLTYWVVYSSLTALETAAGSVFAWIPFYSELKLVFLLWLALPQTKGAAFVFEHFLMPFMKEHISKLDPAFKGAEGTLRSAQADAAKVNKQGPPGFSAPKAHEGYAD